MNPVPDPTHRPPRPRPADAGTDLHAPRPRVPSWNPLARDATASRHSSYARFDGERVRRPLLRAPAAPALVDAHAGLRTHVLDDRFPCLGARSAFNRGHYRFGLYPALAEDAAVRAVCHDLYEFSHEFEAPGDELVSFVAMFRGPSGIGELPFEDLLWAQLQDMHALDSRHFGWDPRVDSDPEAAGFSFSIGGRAFFIVGLHPQASRLSRRAPLPTLVFNLHEQFEGLRSRGKYDGLQQAIRTRDEALQGSINPVLTRFGEAPEARQYAGRAVPEAWQCPFHHLHNGAT